jgi:isoquinoline 1-oxidoreductase beta subunit
MQRRHFLLLGATAASALIVGYGALRELDRVGSGSSLPVRGTTIALNGYVTIDARGQVGVVVPRAEMGQGIRTALAMLVAEELDVSLDQIVVLPAPTDAVYANVALMTEGIAGSATDNLVDSLWAATRFDAVSRMAAWMGLQVTGGSTSVRDAWVPMRQAGALARRQLIAAAAKQWQLRPEQLVVENGRFSFPPEKRSMGYGEVAQMAAVHAVNAPVSLKAPANWKLLGTSPRRIDGREKIDGSAVFGLDVRPFLSSSNSPTFTPPARTRVDKKGNGATKDHASQDERLLYGAVKLVPGLGATLKTHDARNALAMNGVRAVVPLDNGVVVIADNTWRALRAADAVTLVETPRAGDVQTNNDIHQRLQGGLDGAGRHVHEQRGHWPQVGPQDNEREFTATYSVPFLAHACMEPINCTARVTADHCELWVPTQAPVMAQGVAAVMLRLPRPQVEVHQTLLGGGFGRRAEMDMVKAAVTAARAVSGETVQVVWSREEDVRHDAYRPAAMARMTATLDDDGMPQAFAAKVALDSVVGGISGRLLPGGTSGAPDPTSVDGLIHLPYDFKATHVSAAHISTGVPVGFWRSVGFSQNGFFCEGFINELAAQASMDGLALRRRLLRGRPRHLAVLERVARESDWDLPLDARSGRGIALVSSFGAVVAQVVEVRMPRDDVLEVVRVTCAVDCGIAIHPDQIRAQMEGAIVFGLSAALFGEINIRDGAVSEGNFDTYPVVRMPQMPRVDVHVLTLGDTPSGAGEPGTPPLAPALVEAVFQASGQRIRTLPLTRSGIAVA